MNSPELRSAGFEVVDSPTCINTPCLNLGEFEEDASPLQNTYCTNMSEQEFDAVGASETEKSLQALIQHLEKDPSKLMRVLRKRKQEEIDNSGLVSMLKSRLMSRVQGDKYKNKLVTQEECTKKLSELTQGMVMVYEYSQETRGQRFSKRLASKQMHAARRANHLDTTPVKRPADSAEEVLMGMVNVPPPPPAPPLPTFLMRSGWQGQTKAPPLPPPVPAPRLSPLKLNNIMLNSPSILELKRPPLRNGSTGSLVSVHQELMSSNPLQKLRPTKHRRSPGGTPQKKRRCHLNNSIDSVDMSTPRGLKGQEPLATAFLRVLEQKFKNIRSPSPAPSPNLTVFSPGDFTP